MSTPNASEVPSSNAHEASSFTTNPSMTGVDLNEFTIFPKLPTELRSKIWKLAVTPRLVTPDPMFRDAIPAIYHASREARTESKYEFYSNRYLEGPVINFEADILFVDHWHGNTYNCNPFLFAVSEELYLFYEVKRLALVLGGPYVSPLEKWMVDAGTFSEEAINNIFIMLEQICPNLQELIYFVRPGAAGASIEDLYEVYEANGVILQGAMNRLVAKFLKAQADGKWKSLKLTFMRNEIWAQ